MNLNEMTYEQLEALSQDFMARRRELKAQHAAVARRMDELAAEQSAKAVIAKMSPVEKARLKAELAAEA